MDQRKQTGQRGERLARQYLEGKGWTILAMNWRTRLGELDIVAKSPEDAHVVFVEVRTRRSKAYGTAAESVDYRKQQKLRRLGLQYAQMHGLLHHPLRFDVIAVYIPSAAERPQVTHIVAAF